MASNNAVVGTGAAVAGLGGLAVAALVGHAPDTPAPAKPAVARVETRTVVVQTVVHRVRRLRPHHPAAHRAGTPAGRPPRVVSAPAGAPSVAVAPGAAAAPPIRTRASGGSGQVAAPQPIRTRASGGSGQAAAPQPIRTRASGGSGRGHGGDDGGREGHDD